MTPTLVLPTDYVAFSLTRVILDLRSGALKSPSVPPPRPYRKKMVVHSPKKSHQTGQEGTVPPSVAAAATAVSPLPQASPAGRAEEDLLQDFAAWDGENPPGATARRAPVKEDAHVHVNANVNIEENNLTGDRGREEDKISVADGVFGSCCMKSKISVRLDSPGGLRRHSPMGSQGDLRLARQRAF